jgi:nucleoside-diphosphate-sugar epimerase
MSVIYLLGASGFLAKNLYLTLRRKGQRVILLGHDEVGGVAQARTPDVVVNCCGVNRSASQDDYDRANHRFPIEIVERFRTGERPFLVHLSSLMVYGFKDKPVESLSEYQRWFIRSKLAGEEALLSSYPAERLCVVRPSNIFGYSCEPYYNNLLSTLVYEKVAGLRKIDRINVNCVRNLLSVESFCGQVYELIQERRHGFYNVMSNNSLDLGTVVDLVYREGVPDHLSLLEGERDVPNLTDPDLRAEDLVLEENLSERIEALEREVKVYHLLKAEVTIKRLEKLSQPRGDMVEISSLRSKRLYKITLEKNSTRGNHFHHRQTEEFYTNRGHVLYLLSYYDHPQVVYQFRSGENELVVINPSIIHTLTNDYQENVPEIIISSTQEFVKGEIPDTEYVTII